MIRNAKLRQAVERVLKLERQFDEERRLKDAAYHQLLEASRDAA